MDSAYIANPDQEILMKRAAVCLEHQSTPVGDDKMDMIGKYDIQMVSDAHLPTLLVIASNTDSEKSVNELIHTPSDSISLYFLDLSEKNICQRLNKLKEKINNNKKLSIEEKLNLGVILLYAPRKDAYRITETIADLYLDAHDDLDLKMEKCLYSVISILTDAHIDDEQTYGRLTEMIDKNTSNETEQEFKQTDGFVESLRYREEEIAERDRTIVEQDRTIDLLKREIVMLKTQSAK